MSTYQEPIGPLQPFLAAKRVLFERGPVAVATMAAAYATFRVWRRFREPGTFTLAGETHTYFWSNYNVTWANERAIEIPLARAFLARRETLRVIEIGNVLSHYGTIHHPVVDKYETGKYVGPVDVVELKGQYDAILSVSTLEHVGWDEAPRDPVKVGRALSVLESCLAPGGEMLVTAPVGHNPHLDGLFFEGLTPFTNVRAMRRVARDRWEECAVQDLRGVRYGRPYLGANGLIVATLRR
ncbi:MAG TPA: hypothetical protein VNL16_07405 [Chloroflexota bacterium]|nr:hypothetical protein [Chloroflexota bacterium]